MHRAQELIVIGQAGTHQPLLIGFQGNLPRDIVKNADLGRGSKAANIQRAAGKLRQLAGLAAQA